MRERLNFNQGWKFVREYIKDAINVDYPASCLEEWENVNLPHSIRLEPVANSEVFTYQGPAMYRKHFLLDESLESQNLFLEFEAVMGVTDVWVNGVHLHTTIADKTPDSAGAKAHTNYGGYLPFVVKLNSAVRFDSTDNVIVVLTDNSDNPQVPPGKPQGLLDFTYFGGIYRNVWLDITKQVYVTSPLCEDIVSGGGIVIEYPLVSEEKSDVNIGCHIRNTSDMEEEITVVMEIADRDNKSVIIGDSCVHLSANSDVTVKKEFTLKNPHLWNIDTPYLYNLKVRIIINENEIDCVNLKFGIRTIEVDRSRGLLINHKVAPLLSGVNRHQDYPIIGAAAPSSMQRRDAIFYKNAGFSVVRAAHYPMSIDFLNACDELGILLFEATPGWQWYPVEQGEPFTSRVHNNIRQMVRRDRNHPCILGYEIVLNETYHVPYGYTKRSAQVALSEQSSAKIATESYGYDHSEKANGIDMEADFIYGFQSPMEKTKKAVMFLREYADNWMEPYGKFTSRRVTRGVTNGYYPGGEARNLIKANKMLWDTVEENYSLADRYEYQSEHPYFVGCALWTGIDSRGMWSDMSPCGIWDGFRLPKISYYAFESQRDSAKNDYLENLGVETGAVLYIASDWTAKCPKLDKAVDSDPIKAIGTDQLREIYVYSNADIVELSVEQNGEIVWSQTNKPMDEKSSRYLPHPPFYFNAVPYLEGSVLKAKGYGEDGALLVYDERKTAQKPCRIELTANDCKIPLTADGCDMMLVYARILDKNGTLCSDATNSVYFTISGDGEIVGDNDRLADVNPFKSEAGIACCYIRAGMTVGSITLTASSDLLEDGLITLQTQAPDCACADYCEIAKKGSRMSFSMNLDSMPQIGDAVNIGVCNADGLVAPNSIAIENNALWRLGNNYTKLVFECKLIDGDKDAIMQIFLDNILRYQICPNKRTAIELDVCDTTEFEIRMKSNNSCKLALLSPYMMNEASTTDESELHDNLAAGKNATASIHAQSAQKVIDGDHLFDVWMGEPYEDGKVQSWQVDLGDRYNIRNAKVYIGGEMGSDCTNSTYEIHTSPDNESWTVRAKNRRTSWSNGSLDRFTAQDVRYVRVVFTHIDGMMSAAISRFEVYPDYGVDYVKEYNLKGILVEGHDLVFDPKVCSYKIDTLESELSVRAIPQDKNSTVFVQGVKIDSAVNGDINCVNSVKIDRNNCGSQVKICVVPACEKGKKEYIISF